MHTSSVGMNREKIRRRISEPSITTFFASSLLHTHSVVFISSMLALLDDILFGVLPSLCFLYPGVIVQLASMCIYMSVFYVQNRWMRELKGPLQ